MINNQSPNPATRRKARHYAMQALYQWQMAGSDINVIEAEFHSDNDFRKVDGAYFHELLHQVPQHLDAIDGCFNHLLDRKQQELDPISLALLRVACYELMNRMDVPYKVVISEAVSLAKKFGATDAHKYINGVLDKVASQHRELEFKAERS